MLCDTWLITPIQEQTADLGGLHINHPEAMERLTNKHCFILQGYIPRTHIVIHKMLLQAHCATRVVLDYTARTW